MKKIIIALLGIFIFQHSFSQVKDIPPITEESTKAFREVLEPKVTFELSFDGVATLGNFKDMYDDEGMGGVSAAIFAPLSKDFPLDLGLDFGVYFMGKTEPIYSYYSADFYEYKNKTYVTSTMIPLHFVARVYPIKHTQAQIQPYVEGLIGLKMFVTELRSTTYSTDSYEYYEEYSESKVNSAFSYGFGIGVKGRISRTNLLYLNFKVDQLFGNETSYFDASQIKLIDTGKYEYVYDYSRTDVLRISIGLHLMVE